MSSPEPPRVIVREVRLSERDVRLRMPFRFGVVTLTESPQAYVHARVALPDGLARTAAFWTAERAG